MATRNDIIEFLSEYEAVSAVDLQRVVCLHEDRGGSFAQLLVTEGIVDEEDLFFIMSRRLSVPAIPAERLRHLALSPEIRRRVPRRLARQCTLVPVDLDMVSGRLSVAMFDPTDLTALDTLRRVSRVTEIRAYLARRTAVLEALDAVYRDDDDALATKSREKLPLLGPGSPGEGGARTAAYERSSPKVQLDPSLAREIRAMKNVDYFEGTEGADGVPPPPQPPAAEPPTSLAAATDTGERVVRPVDPQAAVRLRGRHITGHSLLREQSVEEGQQAGSAAVAPSGDGIGLPEADDEEPTPPFGTVQPGDDDRTLERMLPHGTGENRPSLPTPAGDEDRTTERVLPGEGGVNRQFGASPAQEEHGSSGPALPDDDGAAARPVERGRGDDSVEDEVTQVRVVLPEQRPRREEPADALMSVREATPVLVDGGGLDGGELDGLTRELLASVGVLVSMLAERIDPAGGSYKEYGRFSRLVARALGLEELLVSRVSLAAHLYGLDLALKREVGTSTDLSVCEVFSNQAAIPGGLGPSLRGLGARVLGLGHSDDDPVPVTARLVQLVADYVELSAETDESPSSTETVVQLLRTGGAEPELVDALSRAVAADERPRVPPVSRPPLED